MSAPELATKWCNDCKQTLPKADFYRNRSDASGCSTYCKTCESRRVRDYQARKRAEIGDEAWLRRRRRAVATHRAMTGNATGRAYMKARNEALQALANRHRREFEHLLLLARRGELEAAS